MILGGEGQAELPDPRRPAGEPADVTDGLRQMALHLETAAVLEERARRAQDPAQVAVLRRRAAQRRREADRLRERLAARGVALRRPARQA